MSFAVDVEGIAEEIKKVDSESVSVQNKMKDVKVFNFGQLNL